MHRWNFWASKKQICWKILFGCFSTLQLDEIIRFGKGLKELAGFTPTEHNMKPEEACYLEKTRTSWGRGYAPSYDDCCMSYVSYVNSPAMSIEALEATFDSYGIGMNENSKTGASQKWCKGS